MRVRTLLWALAAALCLTACGATPPQAPFDQAKQLDRATSGISTACGEKAQVTAFPGEHRQDLETLEATAESSARRLASVYRLDSKWIYQGETVRQIASDGVSMLRDCGLTQAAATLAALTAQR